jgi:multiple sugar transport system substrate-binding protein
MKNIRALLSIWLLVSILVLTACTVPAAPVPDTSVPSGETASTYPPGTMTLFGYGQPQYRQMFYEQVLADNPELAPGVTVEIIQTEGEADARQKVQLSFTAGAWDELPVATSSAPVSMQALAEGGVLMDITEYAESFRDRFAPGTYDQLYYKGRIYCLPMDLRPQLLYYNTEIFEEYNIDPSEMETFQGYIEVGRKLQEASNGEVFLSFIDPGLYTWRYWGRRGLMPQAGARIWDDEGNVVIDADPGAALAFETLRTLHEDELLYSSTVFQPPLYEATREGKIATFYIGAFWDEFLRNNLPDMAGKWRVMAPPVFEEIGQGGAPVIGIECLIDKPNNVYADLYKDLWEIYQFDAEARQKWTERMEELNAPYTNPIALELLEDPFWQLPSEYYGGQSFRQMEGVGLQNVSENLRVTEKDAEADQIISAELEKWVAGSQTMDEAIANMGRLLRDRIGQAPAKE